VDSYAWVELFLGSQEAQNVGRIIAEADEVRTPDIVLAEISRKYLREKAEKETVKSRLETITSASVLTPVGVEVAMKAGEASFELGERAAKQGRRAPSLFDAILLGSPGVYDSTVLTPDEHFEALPETIPIQVAPRATEACCRRRG
jgi:predicted nucleic acid-binding protein